MVACSLYPITEALVRTSSQLSGQLQGPQPWMHGTGEGWPVRDIARPLLVGEGI